MISSTLKAIFLKCALRRGWTTLCKKKPGAAVDWTDFFPAWARLSQLVFPKNAFGQNGPNFCSY